MTVSSEMLDNEWINHLQNTNILKILIIENDFISRSYLSELLSLYQYNCLTAYNATDGLDVYLSEHPDVIICNMLLPGMSGMEFLQQVRENDKKTRIIIMSAFTSERLVVQVFRLGANDFLKKPIQDCDILPILKRYEDEMLDVRKPFDYGEVTEGKVVFVFNTVMDAPSNIVRRLIDEINPEFFDEGDLVTIEMGLSELVTNAIEHGNLSITFDEKSKATDSNMLQDLYEQRLSDEKYAARIVTVTYEYNADECSWLIEDQGDGFDLSKVPDPTAVENIESLHGRGIMMMRLFFDSITYLGCGNQCFVVKKRKFLI